MGWCAVGDSNVSSRLPDPEWEHCYLEMKKHQAQANAWAQKMRDAKNRYLDTHPEKSVTVQIRWPK